MPYKIPLSPELQLKVRLLDVPQEYMERLQWDIPSKLVKMEYPGHYEVRLVSKNGGIRWNHVRVPVSHILGGEYIGLEEIDDDIWEVYYGSVQAHESDGPKKRPSGYERR